MNEEKQCKTDTKGGISKKGRERYKIIMECSILLSIDPSQTKEFIIKSLIF